jgi:hypothetical protein
LAFKKADRGDSVRQSWTNKARIEVRAKPEIVEEVKQMTLLHTPQNVCAKKALPTYIGKFNHISGIIEFLRPFMADLYGVLHGTNNTRAPANCYRLPDEAVAACH